MFPVGSFGSLFFSLNYSPMKMQNEPTSLTIMNHEQTVQALLLSSKEALDEIVKGSRLSIYTTRLVIINNLMRAFMEHYVIPHDIGYSQNVLHGVLVRAEHNKRNWTSADKIALAWSLLDYECLVRSATEDQLNDMFVYIDEQREAARTIFPNQKTGKRVVRRKGK